MEDKKKIMISLKTSVIIFIILLIIGLVSIYFYYNYVVISENEVVHNNEINNMIEYTEINNNTSNEIKDYTYELMNESDFRYEFYFSNGQFRITNDKRPYTIFGTYEEKNNTIICNVKSWHTHNEGDYAYYIDSAGATGEIVLKNENDTILTMESFSEIKGEIIESDENGKEIIKGLKNLILDLEKGNQFELKETISFEIGEYKIQNGNEKIVFNDDYTFDLYLGGENRISGKCELRSNEGIFLNFENFYGKYASEEYETVGAWLKKINKTTLEVYLGVNRKVIKEGEIERVVEISENEFSPFEDGTIFIKETK